MAHRFFHFHTKATKQRVRQIYAPAQLMLVCILNQAVVPEIQLPDLRLLTPVFWCIPEKYIKQDCRESKDSNMNVSYVTLDFVLPIVFKIILRRNTCKHLLLNLFR